MSTNKNALVRYKVLDKCFRNTGKRYFIEDLIAECDKVLLEMDSASNGISRRQIFEDITFMESPEGWGIELKKLRDGKRVYYRYVDTTFSINNMPLNEVEISQLNSAIQVLSQFSGMPQFEWINEMMPKLKQGIATEESAGIIMEFESNQYLKGIHHLGTLYNAIFYKQVLAVSYQPFENDVPSEVIIHPYFLKQYNSRWFLLGYNPENNKYDWNLAIDRMVDVQVKKGKYQKNMIDWQAYFDDIIGVTKPEGVNAEEIVLHFFGRTARYMETKPIHGSQKSKRGVDGQLEVRLRLIVNYELERLILSYADSVKVIAPEELVRVVKERLDRAGEQY